jgi:hypothetical protein
MNQLYRGIVLNFFVLKNAYENSVMINGKKICN